MTNVQRAINEVRSWELEAGMLLKARSGHIESCYLEFDKIPCGMAINLFKKVSNLLKYSKAGQEENIAVVAILDEFFSKMSEENIGNFSAIIGRYGINHANIVNYLLLATNDDYKTVYRWISKFPEGQVASILANSPLGAWLNYEKNRSLKK